MEMYNKIIEHLRIRFEKQDDIRAFWIEGSIAQGYADEFSDLDIWLSVDDDKIFAIYDDVEKILSEIAPIDYKYVAKSRGELGQTVYHLKGTSEFHTIDINTQGVSRETLLTEGVDDAKIIFDKDNIVKFRSREEHRIDIEAKREKLRGFYDQMYPNIVKNLRRNKNPEALGYYHQILRYATKFLRLKHDWPEKIDFDLKHIYRDIAGNEAKKLEIFYNASLNEIESKLPDLKAWIYEL